MSDSASCPWCRAIVTEEDLLCPSCGLMLEAPLREVTSGKYVPTEPTIVRALLSNRLLTDTQVVHRPPVETQAPVGVHEQATAVFAMPMDGYAVPSLSLKLEGMKEPLQAFEAHVASFIDGEQTVAELARLAKLSEIEVKVVLKGLLERRVVEVRRQEGAPLPFEDDESTQPPGLGEEPLGLGDDFPFMSAQPARTGGVPILDEEPPTFSESLFEVGAEGARPQREGTRPTTPATPALQGRGPVAPAAPAGTPPMGRTATRAAQPARTRPGAPAVQPPRARPVAPGAPPPQARAAAAAPRPRPVPAGGTPPTGRPAAPGVATSANRAAAAGGAPTQGQPVAPARAAPPPDQPLEEWLFANVPPPTRVGPVMKPPVSEPRPMAAAAPVPAPAPSAPVREEPSVDLRQLLPPPAPLRTDGAEDFLQRAIRYERAGQVDRAIETLEKALERVERPAGLYNKLALILLHQRQDYGRAMRLLEKATELEPDNTVYQQNLMKVVSMAAAGHGKDGKKKGSGLLSKLLGKG